MLLSNYVKPGGGSESVTIYGAVFNNDLEVAGKKFVYSFSPCAKNGMSVICLEISENKKNSIKYS